MIKVLTDDQILRICMENLKLKDNQEEYARENQRHSIRGQINQVTDHGVSVNQAGGVWQRLELRGVQQDGTEKVEEMKRPERKFTEKGREYRISILHKNKSSLISRIIRILI